MIDAAKSNKTSRDATNLAGGDIVAIFYPSSQFCEIIVSLLSLQTQPNRAPNPFQRRVEYGKYGGNPPTSSATPATTPRRAWEVSAMSVCLDLFRLSSNTCDRSFFLLVFVICLRHYYHGTNGLVFVIDSNDRDRVEAWQPAY